METHDHAVSFTFSLICIITDLRNVPNAFGFVGNEEIGKFTKSVS